MICITKMKSYNLIDRVCSSSSICMLVSSTAYENIDLTHFSLSIIIFFLHTHTLTQICFSFLFIPAAFHMFQFRTSISLLLFTALVLKSKENRNEERREEKKHFSWIINSHRKKRHSFGIGGKSGWWTMSFERNAIKSQWINDKMES